jgi:hypothetical protein
VYDDKHGVGVLSSMQLNLGSRQDDFVSWRSCSFDLDVEPFTTAACIHIKRLRGPHILGAVALAL